MSGRAPATGDPEDRRERRFALLVTLLHAALLAVVLAHHEPWRDEWQAWMIARDSESLAALLHNMRFEGHPPGWHTLLFLLSRITRSLVAAQVVHALLAVAVVWVVLRHAPFSRTQKALFAFGYFPLFEYAAITRGYVIGILALLAACAVWPLRRRTYIPFAICLAVMAQSSAYGFLLALSLGAAATFEWILDGELRRTLGTRRAALAGALLTVFVSLGVAAAVMKPPAGEGYQGHSLDTELGTRAAGVRVIALIPARVIAPIPHFRDGLPVWRETWVAEAGGVENAALYVAIIGALYAAWTARRPVALAFLGVATAAQLGLAYFVHFGYLRHHGHLFFAALAAFWLARSDGVTWERARGPAAIRPWLNRAGPAIVTGVLALHVVAAAIFWLADVRAPFTPAADAARVLAANGADRHPVAATPTAHASSLAGYLDRPVHYLDDDVRGTFVLWDWPRRPTPPDSVLTRAARALAASDTVLLATEVTPMGAVPPGVSVEPLASDTIAILPEARFRLYRLVRSASNGVLSPSPSPSSLSPPSESH